MNYLRPLNSIPLAEQFVRGVLGLDNANEIEKAAVKIKNAEWELADMKDTLVSTESRSTFYQDEAKRKVLRGRIFNELKSKTRLAKDDKIQLGKGGALPTTAIQSNKQAYFITGLPASGKSSVADEVADAYGAVLLDSDYAKRKFPEFKHGQYGASILHKESQLIVFGSETEDIFNLRDYCITEKYNVVVAKIGDDEDALCELADYFRSYGYTVHLTLVSLDRQKAVMRAYKRFVSSGRYVPLSLIFDQYANNPTLAYYRLKQQQERAKAQEATYEGGFASFGKVSTDVALNERPKFIESSPRNPALLFTTQGS